MTIATKGNEAKCFFCGLMEKLYYNQINEWLCKKCHDKINKTVDKLKQGYTRYKDVDAWKGAHKL